MSEGKHEVEITYIQYSFLTIKWTYFMAVLFFVASHIFISSIFKCFFQPPSSPSFLSRADRVIIHLFHWFPHFLTPLSSISKDSKSETNLAVSWPILRSFKHPFSPWLVPECSLPQWQLLIPIQPTFLLPICSVLALECPAWALHPHDKFVWQDCARIQE